MDQLGFIDNYFFCQILEFDYKYFSKYLTYFFIFEYYLEHIDYWKTIITCSIINDDENHDGKLTR